LEERPVCIREVAGSSPAGSISIFDWRFVVDDDKVSRFETGQACLSTHAILS
jgi:hypothetical protein